MQQLFELIRPDFGRFIRNSGSRLPSSCLEFIDCVGKHLGFGGRRWVSIRICICICLVSTSASFCICICFLICLEFIDCMGKQPRSTWVLVAVVGPTRPCHLVAKLRSHGDAGTDHKDIKKLCLFFFHFCICFWVQVGIPCFMIKFSVFLGAQVF